MPFPLLHPWPQRLALASAIVLAAGCVTSEGLEPTSGRTVRSLHRWRADPFD
ncbi:hypothetical protein ACLBV4_25215, partial [Pseudomonas aeruginosa]|uniref:hypothetical protein n=1 Tax=Pseudomonas aeruginosa TaxID=287 RepID=UPI003968F86C